MAKRKSSEAKRASIRHAAYICFREHGYHSTSIDDICSAADISKGSFYWHYGAKLDVFVDILETWTQEVVEELLSQFDEASRHPDRFHRLGLAFEREFHRARAIVPLWAEFALHARRDHEIQISLAKFFRRARASIAEILRQSSMQLTEDQILGSAALILGAYTGVILQELADPSQDAFKWSQSFLGILGGLSSPSQIPSPPILGHRISEVRLTSFLEGYPHSVSDLFLSLRQIILTAQLIADEKHIRGWGVIGYSDGGLVCHLKPQNTGVELAFYKGDTIHDSHGTLNARGKNRKWVLFQPGISELSPVGDWVRQAFSLNGRP